MAWVYMGGVLNVVGSSYVQLEKLKGPWTPTLSPWVPSNVKTWGLVQTPALCSDQHVRPCLQALATTLDMALSVRMPSA